MAASATFADLLHDIRAAAPTVALVLGSGWQPAVHRLRVVRHLPFLAVPGLLDTTVPGHQGSLLLGEWVGRRVLVFSGRLHVYEGHPWRIILRSVTLAHDLGARVFLTTNAAGGIHDALVPGSLLAATDHIDWTQGYCWRQPGPGGLGPRRPSPYSPRLLRALAQAAAQVGLPLHHGVYAQVQGPCYETPAEIRALRQWGAAAVGMSTAREIQAAHELGMACAALSCITNRAAGLHKGPLRHDDVLATAALHVEQRLALLEAFLRGGL